MCCETLRDVKVFLLPVHKTPSSDFIKIKLTLNLLSHLSALGDIILLWLKTFLACSHSWGVFDANRRNIKRFFSAGSAQQAFPFKHRGQKTAIICTPLISEIENAPRSSHRHLYSSGVSVCHALTAREKMKNNKRRLLISAPDYICMSSPVVCPAADQISNTEDLPFSLLYLLSCSAVTN